MTTAPMISLETIHQGNRASRARERDLIRNDGRFPWRHFRLPNRQLPRGEWYSSDNSDSEDDTPKRFKLGYWPPAPTQPEELLDDSLTTLHLQEVESRPETAVHSCHYCSSIFLDLRRKQASHTTRRDRTGSGEKGWRTSEKKLDLNVEQATAAAEDGCNFYATLVRLDGGPSKGLNNEHFGMAQGRIPYQITMQQDACVFSPGRRAGEFLDFVLYPVPREKSSHPYLGHELPPNLLPNSQLSFRRVRGWLDECRLSHTRCNTFQHQSFMPKRLIEVTAADKGIRARLVTNAPLAPYAALSYCWGGDQKSKTIKQILADYEKNIPFDTLPQTLQDALAVTLGVGLRYLWVDAMAIVRDDPNDIEDQISQMHRIYLGASFTIAAAQAVTSSDGFLAPRSQYQPTKVKARFDDNVFGEVLLAPKAEEFGDYNLFTRGWTFQETQLSSRILAYGRRELVYCCLERIHRDGGYERAMYRVPGHTYDHFARDPARQIVRHLDPGNQNYGANSHPVGWGHMVAAYMNRFLTNGADKLPAISAMAEEYVRTQPVTSYHAGLWKEYFLRQVLWKTSFRETATRPPASAGYRAPSWSWAAIDGGITAWVNGNIWQPEPTYTYTASLLDV
ncbi:heterokaryon incompatibility protein-domain-containing protein [Podospora australis]|uniref:Heterokaryon incompatibility protein-domain-containing protein n=1 Tax=Podospora australis TaxID=1536484 RepID=A0AAN7AGN2_9PEZI|nr:heterokaryon incompatibility protein-domain-containing protein [Podospora australis]